MDGTVACIQFAKEELGKALSPDEKQKVLKAQYGDTVMSNASLVESVEQLEMEIATTNASDMGLDATGGNEVQSAYVALLFASPLFYFNRFFLTIFSSIALSPLLPSHHNYSRTLASVILPHSLLSSPSLSSPLLL